MYKRQGEERYYNSYEKTFGKLGDGFATNEETSVICVPINGVTDKRNLLGRLEMEANDQKYTISGYDLDAETEYAGLVVMLDRLNADAVTGALESSKPAVAEEVITTINEEGETVRQVTFWSEGKKMSYPIAETKAADDTLGQIRAGTVFYYTKNVSDELSEATILKQLDADMGYYNDHTGGTLFGQINELRYKKLDTVTNRFVHQLMVSTAEDGASLEKVNINVRNQPPIYCYSNRGGQTSVSIVEPEALRAGEYGGDKVFVGSKNEETEIVVVVD